MIASRRCLFGLLACVASLSPALALAQTGGAPAEIVARNCVLDLTTGKATRITGLTGYVVRANRIGDGVFNVGNLTIDLATKTRIRIDKGNVMLEDFAGKATWSRSLQEVGLTDHLTTRRLTRDRAVLVSRTKMIALDRKTGKVAWQHKKLPAQTLTIHRDLVVMTTTVGEDFVMRAIALHNGAKAGLTKLQGKAVRVAVGDHGIAVASKNHVEVFDRFGPKLWTLEHGVDELAAHPDGWLMRRKLEVTLLDRSGKETWQSKLREPKFLDSHIMLATSTGDVVITTHHFMSDSGVFCQALDGKRGEELWACQVPGLGVPHSKYFHHAYARDRADVIDIVSQGSAGAFVVTLDAGSGEEQSRHPVK